MIEDGQYCINILNQTKAISSAVHSLESALLEKHLQHCVKGAMCNNSNETDQDQKIEELMTLFRKRLK